MNISEEVEILAKSINDSNNEKYKENLHLSKLAMCGYKYRYELDNHIKYPFSWKYNIGNAFESQYLKLLSKLYVIERQKTCKLNISEAWFYGHIDAYLPRSQLVLELKSSYGPELKDIYRRQLVSYLIALGLTKGKVIVYGYGKNEPREYDIELDASDISIFNKNISAFFNNRYEEGIENYLCKYCPNTDCPLNKKVKNDNHIS